MRAWDEDVRDSLDAGDSVGYHALLHMSQGQVCTLVKSLGTPVRHTNIITIGLIDTDVRGHLGYLT